MSILPYNYHILVRILPESDKIGDLQILYKPENVHKDAIGFGIVEAIGPGRWTTKGHRFPITEYVVGDTVIFVKFLKETGSNVGVCAAIGDDLMFLDSRKDILGVIIDD